MQRSQRRKQASSDTATGDARQGCLVLAGALCLCLAALLVDGMREALGAWYWRDGYVRAELEVLGVSSSGRRTVRLRAPSSGPELLAPAGRFPELTRSNDGVVVQVADADALRGRRVSAWLNLAARSFALGDVRALPAGLERPGLRALATRGLALGALLGLGAGLMRAALRRR